jgi:hypothetical protein
MPDERLSATADLAAVLSRAKGQINNSAQQPPALPGVNASYPSQYYSIADRLSTEPRAEVPNYFPRDSMLEIVADKNTRLLNAAECEGLGRFGGSG